MRQFITGSDAAFAELAERATGACVHFRDQEMPPGSDPARARVGFEIRPDGSAWLLVDRGIRYTGSQQSVGTWLGAGGQRFGSFPELRWWIQQVLGPCYSRTPPGPAPRPEPSAGAPPGAGPEHLTDFQTVRARLQQETTPRLLDAEQLFRALASTVRGQDEALCILARRVCRHLARPSPRRPVSLFAVGPTGVGKTKTAEALPAALKSLYQDAADFGALRLDMGEYQEAHRISQLLGSPQGYVGYGDGAQLVDALALNPRTIVLFDEIDKAHPDILRALMNAMDAGRLSSARPTATGREIDCRQAVFFFTSNFDAAGILKDLEERAAFAQPAVVDEVCRRRLRAAGVAPELVGRVGTFLAFRPLSPETRAEIVALAVATVGREYGVTVARIDPGVIVTVLASTQRQAFGARPDEYLVDELLGDAFARAAQLRHPGPFEILEGPPVVCVPAVVSSEGPRGAPSGGPSNGQQG